MNCPHCLAAVKLIARFRRSGSCDLSIALHFNLLRIEKHGGGLWTYQDIGIVTLSN